MVSLKNPEVPVTHEVPEGKVEVGQKYVIKGEVLEDATRITFNLMDKSTQQKIFHLDFRFNEDQTVRNTNFPTGTWGSEERSPNPLSKGHPFKIEVKVLEDHYEVEINDQHHCNYHHRVSPSNAEEFQFKGDVRVKSIKVKD